MGCCVGEIDDASLGVGSTVVDGDDDFLAVAKVAHEEACAEWIGAVGAGEGVVVKTLTAACLCSGGALGIIGSLTLLLTVCRQKGKA